MAGGSSSSRNAGLIRGCSAAGLACLSVGVLVIAAGLILPSQIDRKLRQGVSCSMCEHVMVACEGVHNTKAVCILLLTSSGHVLPPGVLYGSA
jgi:hypothetical protein